MPEKNNAADIFPQQAIPINPFYYNCLKNTRLGTRVPKDKSTIHATLNTCFYRRKTHEHKTKIVLYLNTTVSYLY